MSSRSARARARRATDPSAPKLTRQGIRDLGNTIRLRPREACLPDAHDWRKTGRTRVTQDFDRLRMHNVARVEQESVCSACGEAEWE